MPVQHKLLTLPTGTACGLTLFTDARTGTATAVVTELPDNPGAPATAVIDRVVRKAQKDIGKTVPLAQVAWVYRCNEGEHERLFRMTFEENLARPSLTPIETADFRALVRRAGGFIREVFLPKFNALKYYFDTGQKVSYEHL